MKTLLNLLESLYKSITIVKRQQHNSLKRQLNFIRGTMSPSSSCTLIKRENSYLVNLLVLFSFMRCLILRRFVLGCFDFNLNPRRSWFDWVSVRFSSNGVFYRESDSFNEYDTINVLLSRHRYILKPPWLLFDRLTTCIQLILSSFGYRLRFQFLKSSVLDR